MSEPKGCGGGGGWGGGGHKKGREDICHRGKACVAGSLKKNRRLSAGGKGGFGFLGQRPRSEQTGHPPTGGRYTKLLVYEGCEKSSLLHTGKWFRPTRKGF